MQQDYNWFYDSAPCSAHKEKNIKLWDNATTPRDLHEREVVRDQIMENF